jgi:hypothetical protein
LSEINDVNRMIKNKCTFFKTLFIRYLSKNDQVLDREVMEMVNNLREFGSKTSAKAVTIENQIITAMTNFNKIRDKRMIDETVEYKKSTSINEEGSVQESAYKTSKSA